MREKRKAWIENGVGYVPLSGGLVVKVSPLDVELVAQWNWFPRRGQKGSVYAARHTHINGKGKLILMHRYLLSLEDSTVHVDHANHDTLDNRRENIRECRNGENMLNKVKYCNNKSGFKGVCRVHTSGLYRARLTIKGKKISVGTFPTAEEAYAAYLSAAEEHHGEFACAG